MLIMQCSESLGGVFCAFFRCCEIKRVPDSITFGEEWQTGLQTEYEKVEFDIEKAERIRRWLYRLGGDEFYYGIKKLYASGREDKLKILLDYLLMVYKYGVAADARLQSPYIIAANEVKKQVGYEIERIKGFLRFKAVSGIEAEGERLSQNDGHTFLYARITPDNDILPWITEYFAERNSATAFVIHDAKRGMASLFNGKETITVPFGGNIVLTASEQEEATAELFRRYFYHVSIASRKNPRLQRAFLPMRYRDNMIEFWENLPEGDDSPLPLQENNGMFMNCSDFNE